MAHSSVKTHRRAQQVKTGPHGRVKKALRMARAQNQRTSHLRWMADFLGVDPREMPEWGRAHEYREARRLAAVDAGEARQEGHRKEPVTV